MVPDVVGYGESDKPDGRYDRPYYARWLAAFMDGLSMKKASLAGNSQGGAIAIQFAMDHPQRVSHLVPVCSAGLCRMRNLGWGAIANMIGAQLLVSEQSIRRLARYLIYDARNFPLDVGLRYFSAVAGTQGAKRPFLNSRGRAVYPFARRELAGVRCPTLMLWGTEDRIIKTAGPWKDNPAIGGAVVECMPGCGHTPFIDKPEVFTRHVVEFILQKGRHARIPG